MRETEYQESKNEQENASGDSALRHLEPPGLVPFKLRSIYCSNTERTLYPYALFCQGEKPSVCGRSFPLPRLNFTYIEFQWRRHSIDRSRPKQRLYPHGLRPPCAGWRIEARSLLFPVRKGIVHHGIFLTCKQIQMNRA
jgi:hypothetical protein